MSDLGKLLQTILYGWVFSRPIPWLAKDHSENTHTPTHTNPKCLFLKFYFAYQNLLQWATCRRDVDNWVYEAAFLVDVCTRVLQPKLIWIITWRNHLNNLKECISSQHTSMPKYLTENCWEKEGFIWAHGFRCAWGREGIATGHGFVYSGRILWLMFLPLWTRRQRALDQNQKQIKSSRTRDYFHQRGTAFSRFHNLLKQWCQLFQCSSWKASGAHLSFRP